VIFHHGSDASERRDLRVDHINDHFSFLMPVCADTELSGAALSQCSIKRAGIVPRPLK
jgi:hypothetical protein